MSRFPTDTDPSTPSGFRERIRDRIAMELYSKPEYEGKAYFLIYRYNLHTFCRKYPIKRRLSFEEVAECLAHPCLRDYHGDLSPESLYHHFERRIPNGAVAHGEFIGMGSGAGGAPVSPLPSQHRRWQDFFPEQPLPHAPASVDSHARLAPVLDYMRSTGTTIPPPPPAHPSHAPSHASMIDEDQVQIQSSFIRSEDERARREDDLESLSTIDAFPPPAAPAAAPPHPRRPPIQPPPGYHIPPPFGTPYAVHTYNPDGSVKSTSIQRRLGPDEEYDPSKSYEENFEALSMKRRRK
jgi:hypothetical protein